MHSIVKASVLVRQTVDHVNGDAFLKGKTIKLVFDDEQQLLWWMRRC